MDWFVEGDQGTVVLWYDDSDEYRVEKPIEVGGTFEFADVLPGTVNLMAFVEGRDGFSCDSDVVTLITCGADYEVEIASIATCETG